MGLHSAESGRPSPSFRTLLLAARRLSQRRGASVCSVLRGQKQPPAPRTAAQTGPLASQETPLLQHSNKRAFTKFHEAKRPRLQSCSDTRHNVKALGKAFATTHPSVCNSGPDSAVPGSYLPPHNAGSGSSSPKPHSLSSGILHHTNEPPGQEQPLTTRKMRRRSFSPHLLRRGIRKSS